MHWHVVMVPFLTLSAVCLLVYTFAAFEVIPATWDFMRFMLYIGLVFLYIWIALSFFRDRQKKKQDRLKMMLSHRQSSQ
jgi:RsiW-degrading membrane proteinase PrsW (M82 family)